MSFINSIQSFLPRPEHRSRPEIDRDLEDEFAFHLEMRTRAIEAEEGVDREAARGFAHERFGNIDRIRKDCQRIALKERIMLQRVNLVLMIVVTVIVLAVGVQVMITQRYNTLALQAITADLARMKFDAAAGERNPTARDAAATDSTGPARVLVEGDIESVGWHSIDMSRGTTISDLLKSLKVRDDQWVTYRRNGAPAANTPKPVRDYLNDSGSMVLRPNDELVLKDTIPIEARREYYRNRWVTSSEPMMAWHAPSADGRDWHLRVRTGRGSGMATLVQEGDDQTWTLSFRPEGVAFQAANSYRARSTYTDWDVRDDRLVISFADVRDSPNATPRDADLPRPPLPATEGEIIFERSPDDIESRKHERIAYRSQMVGRFVVDVFAIANPNDPKLRDTITKYLDERESELDKDYADDPATASMIRELIAARRKLFEADDRAAEAATAEAKLAAMNDFLVQMLTSADPAIQSQVSASDVLDQAADRVEVLFDGTDAADKAHVLEAIDRARKTMAGESVLLPPLDKRTIVPVIQQLMVASMPNAAAEHLPARADLDRWNEAIHRIYAQDPKSLENLGGMIATVRTRLDDIEGGHGAIKPAAPRENDDEFPEVSPFRAVRWQNYTPFVNVEGIWGELVSINGIPAAEIIDFCTKRYGNMDRKRFTEDLVQAMTEMGKPPMDGTHVKLQIKEHKTGTVMAIDRATMTETNQRLLRDANNAASENEPPYPVWTGAPPESPPAAPAGAP